MARAALCRRRRRRTHTEREKELLLMFSLIIMKNIFANHPFALCVLCIYMYLNVYMYMKVCFVIRSQHCERNSTLPHILNSTYILCVCVCSTV